MNSEIVGDPSMSTGVVGFELTEDQVALKELARDYFDQVAGVEVMSRIDESETYPAEILSGMAEIGLWGIAIDEEYGGNRIDHVTRAVLVEEVSRAGSSVSYAWIPTALFCADALSIFGTDEMKQRFLPGIADGSLRMAMSLTEPESGSDLMSLTTKARRDGDDYVVSGQKVFTTGADSANFLLALVRTDPEARPRSAFSMLFIPTDAPGVSISPLRKMMGQGTHTCEVFLDEVRVPAENLLGEEGAGAAVVFELMEADRVYTAAQSVGIAQHALDIASRYANERYQFGKPIIQHQAVAHLLADMDIQVGAARALTFAAANRIDLGLPCGRESAIAKVFASEAGSKCTSNGVQVLGGYGVMRDYGMERLYRESKIQEIFGGTNQVLRTVIANSMDTSKSTRSRR